MFITYFVYQIPNGNRLVIKRWTIFTFNWYFTKVTLDFLNDRLNAVTLRTNAVISKSRFALEHLSCVHSNLILFQIEVTLTWIVSIESSDFYDGALEVSYRARPSRGGFWRLQDFSHLFQKYYWNHKPGKVRKCQAMIWSFWNCQKTSRIENNSRRHFENKINIVKI